MPNVSHCCIHVSHAKMWLFHYCVCLMLNMSNCCVCLMPTVPVSLLCVLHAKCDCHIVVCVSCQMWLFHVSCAKCDFLIVVYMCLVPNMTVSLLYVSHSKCDFLIVLHVSHARWDCPSAVCVSCQTWLCHCCVRSMPDRTVSLSLMPSITESHCCVCLMPSVCLTGAHVSHNEWLSHC